MKLQRIIPLLHSINVKCFIIKTSHKPYSLLINERALKIHTSPIATLINSKEVKAVCFLKLPEIEMAPKTGKKVKHKDNTFG